MPPTFQSLSQGQGRSPHSSDTLYTSHCWQQSQDYIQRSWADRRSRAIPGGSWLHKGHTLYIVPCLSWYLPCLKPFRKS